MPTYNLDDNAGTGDGDEDEDDVEAFYIEEDVFSIFFVSPVFSIAFWYALGIFALQMTILILAAINLLEGSTPNNPISVPAHTSGVVIFAEIIAIFTSVLTATDIFAFFDALNVEYDECVLETFPAASRSKWHLGNVLRLVEGVMGIFVAFLFICQADDVLQLFLDFAAVQFVSEMDNIGFYVIDRGYILMNLGDVTDNIKRTTFLARTKLQVCAIGHRKHSLPTTAIRNASVASMCLFLYIAWMLVWYEQNRGDYFWDDCTEFQVNFVDKSYHNFFDYKCDQLQLTYENVMKDEKATDEEQMVAKQRLCSQGWTRRNDAIDYSSFNGMYSVATKINSDRIQMFHDRPLYIQKHEDQTAFQFYDKSPSGEFKYCEQLKAWVFTIPGVTKGVGADDCSWLMKSRKTEALSLDDVDEQDWMVWSGVVSEASVDITCVECRRGKYEKINAPAVGCSFHGVCADKRGNKTREQICKCDEGWMGPQCATCVACGALSIDSPLWGDSDGRGMIRLNETDKKPLDIYGRPVYYHGYVGNGSIAEPLMVVLYAGDKYWIMNLDELDDPKKDISGPKQLVTELKSFHSTWDIREDYKPVYISEVTDRSMPVGVSWKDHATHDDAGIGRFKCLSTERMDFCNARGFLLDPNF